MTTLPLPIRQPRVKRIGGWLPKNHSVIHKWLGDLVKEVRTIPKKAKLYIGPVEELQTLIESTAELRMLASAMFTEVPNKPPYNENPIGERQIESYHEMLLCFQVVMTERAPIWQKVGYEVGLVGFPFNAILDWPMATPSGYAFFLKPEVNLALKKILDTWSQTVLMTSKSQYVLTTDPEGWLSEEAMGYIEADSNVIGQPKSFVQLFECNPDLPYWGFGSWDDFFIRTFRNFDVDRPIAYPDKPEWIVNSCESRSFALQSNVQEYDTFWLKGQPYSLAEMLNHNELVSEFVGGTVYQAFLSATSYHRWNSPVEGEVLYSEVVPGTYFSEPTLTSFYSAFDPTNSTSEEIPDKAAPDLSQGYITHVATRAIFYIQAKDPVGLIALIYVGMADVSSCEILPQFQKGSWPAPVKKGEEVGMFHHGGSTHCLITRPQLKMVWNPKAFPGNSKKNLAIRSELAMVYEVTE